MHGNLHKNVINNLYLKFTTYFYADLRDIKYNRFLKGLLEQIIDIYICKDIIMNVESF